MSQFTDNDQQQFSKSGVTEEKILKQITTFEEGIAMISLEKEAVVSSGIVKFNKEEEAALIGYFENGSKAVEILKFVPASGAASRMFKALFNFLESFDPKLETLENYIYRAGDEEIAKFFNEYTKLPFADIVNNRIHGKAATKEEEYYLFVEEMLSKEALNYGFYPKGLLPFHNYGDYVSSAFEEHLKEGAKYAAVADKARLHFTISPQHEEMFNEEYERVKKRVEAETNSTFQIDYSFQKPSTDTIAVTMDNQPFRNDDGSILFRPGGHGALIENLNEQDADIIFIKNIDNVIVPEYLDVVADSKKVLAGLLLKIREKAFHYAKLLDNNKIDGEQLLSLKSFLENQLNVRFSDSFFGFSIEQQLAVFKDKIDRPIRVCGMVLNEGEPGGGPFWIRDAHDHISLQIIESAQVDLSDEEQLRIFKNSTHFNPVDLVCSVKNYKGEKYNLLNFVDEKQGFISSKTKDGKALKALELPGLWNGAMAYWNTIFVEVPLLTFNPVKTVNDLLKPTHQIS